MGRIGPGELALIAFIALMLFGASRLGEVGRGLGDALRSLKQGLKDDPEPPTHALSQGAAVPAPHIENAAEIGVVERPHSS
ncbi:MAG: twin-arginine translocase TatA/TatE family subunit [Polyangiaceae bacterium]